MSRTSSLLRPDSLAAMLVVGAIGAIACAPERIVDPPAPPPPAVAPPSVPTPVAVASRFEIAFLPSALMEGARVMPSVLAYTSQGLPAPLPVLTWETTDSAVLAIDVKFAHTALLRAVGPGTATVTIRGGGVTEEVHAVVHPIPEGTVSPDSSGVVISDFQMLYYFDEYAGRIYAPQLVMSVRDGLSYDVLRLQFAIPGLPVLPPCSSVRALATIPAQLFSSNFGRWELEYPAAMPHDVGARATVVIDLRRSSGGTIRMLAEGEIVLGRPPSVFAGGGGFEPWSCL